MPTYWFDSDAVWWFYAPAMPPGLDMGQIRPFGSAWALGPTPTPWVGV